MTTPQEKIQKKIREILGKCSTGKYIFRGENKDYGKVSSGLYRQYCQRDDSDPTANDPLIDNEHFFVSSVEKDIVEKIRQHIRPGALNIEVLTELQHYGGKTALLDFSKDMHIALFFACDGNVDKNGRVIFFETSELTESTEIDYDQIDTTKHTLISPSGKSPRVIFQSSIFVHVPKGYLEVCEGDIIEIESNLKKPLLDYLSKYFNINTETIYNDIQGFIRNQNNYSTVEIELYRGVANATSGDHEEAIVNYTKAIDLNPQYALAYNNRGLANSNLGNHEVAITDYNKAIELNPQHAIAYDSRGSAKSALHKHEEAIEDYNKAIELNPQYISYNNRGAANAALHKYKEAIEDYTKAIELNTQYAKLYNNRGNAKLHSGKNEEAIEDYNKAIEHNPQYAEAYNNRGLAKSALGEPKEAIEYYTKAIELNPQFTDAYYNRGNANRNLSNNKEAIEDYSKAIELNPQHPQIAEAYINRGITKASLEQHKEAIEDYINAKTLFAEAENMEMVKKCKEVIARLKKLITPQ